MNTMNKNYFQGTVESPYHISIGAVARNKEGKICCHYFETFSHKEVGRGDDFYILMRETMEPNETLEQTLTRGLMEEFGVEATLYKYLGSIVSHFPKKDVTVEKTTLYFLCDVLSFDETKRRANDEESTSKIMWLPPEELIIKMKEQGQRLHREDLDESSILERL